MDKAKPIDELISSLRKINSIADEKYNNSTFTKDTTSSNKSQKSGGLGVEFAVLMALNLLHEFAGFRVTDHLEHKIKHIFRNSSQEELQAWIHHMERDSSKADLISLVEDLANHETYFFRDMNQLDIISNKLLPEMLKAKFHAVDSKVKIWSAACSTGEEAYTLAMLLSDALLDARVGYSGKPGEIFFPTNWEIEVLGSDISRQALRIASQGSYGVGGLDSFRQFPKKYRKYIDNEGALDSSKIDISSDHVQINRTIMKLANFKQFNLLETQAPGKDFDIIFCRNVFIYLDHEAQKKIILMLHSAMRPGGYLILSPVDTMPYPELFKEHWIDHCVIYEKNSARNH